MTILFCASLPECYVVPDLAAVLHATGQLEERAEHRIRTTGAMIFPVMMGGGLTRPDGSGIAQILKVRLIHATVRNLILRGSPRWPPPPRCASRTPPTSRGVIPPLATIQPGDSMYRALFVHGWDLRALRAAQQPGGARLHAAHLQLRLPAQHAPPRHPASRQQQEEDYLHAWNVAGHFLGIRRELMVDTMEEAEALFARMQARGRDEWARRAGRGRPAPGARRGADGRDGVGDSRRAVQGVPGAAHAPAHRSRRAPATWGSTAACRGCRESLFAVLMGTARGIDAVVRLVFPDFSLSRLITRAIGYRLTCALLMSQTRDLSVPGTLRPGIRSLIAHWGEDAKASRWMNALEDRLDHARRLAGAGANAAGRRTA